MRVKAVISYDGSEYYGFQKQNSTSKTVTQTIEKALKSLGINSPIVGSGRTDAKVHASGQVIHFDLPSFWKDLKKLKIALNRKLDDIAFKHISKVSKDFHARFDASKRTYRYIFKTTQPTVFEQKYIAHYTSFDSDKLKEGLKCLEGRHDFDYLRKTGTLTHTSIREIYQTGYIQKGNYHIIYFTANSFLRSQIRMMVALIMQYAQGRIRQKHIQEQLACQIKHSTALAPAQGLYLARILYL